VGPINTGGQTYNLTKVEKGSCQATTLFSSLRCGQSPLFT